MQPSNTPERKRAFIIFLLLFVVSAGMVILLAFSSVQVPLKQNQQLREQMDNADKDREFSKKILDQMTDIINMLDSINKKAPNPEILNGEISDRLSKMNLTVNEDSAYNKELYHNVFFILSELQTARKDMRRCTATGDEIAMWKKKYEDVNNQLEEYKRNYNERAK
ncbi:MAG: type VI secretion system TssO [Ferruginibacter sp.]